MTKFVSTAALTEFWAQVKAHVASAIATLSTVYAAISHTHAISDVTDLQTTLDGKAAATHKHAIADVTDLQTTLDGKAAAEHDHTVADITDLATTLAGYAEAEHTHEITDTTGLQDALDAKAPLASPTFTGTPTAPTASAGTNTTQIATTQFVTAAISTAVGNLQKLTYQVVEDLPEVAAADASVIYLVKNDGESGNNLYDEYLFISSGEGTGSFELIGQTGVHLDQYWAKADLEEMTTSEVQAICV